MGIARWTFLTSLVLWTAGWVRPNGPTQTRLVADSAQRLSHVTVAVNGEVKLVQVDQEVSVVRGDILELKSAHLNNGTEGLRRLNLVGYANSTRSNGDDRGQAIDTAKELKKRWSEEERGDLYAIAAESGSLLHGQVFLRIIEPALKYAVLTINQKEAVFRANEQVKVKAADVVQVKEVVTNLADNADVRFQIVGLIPEQLVEVPAKPGEIRNYEVRFARKDAVFARIPMQIEY